MEGRGKRMKQEAYFCTVKELNELGKEQIPEELYETILGGFVA